jgi:hypothetical protein
MSDEQEYEQTFEQMSEKLLKNWVECKKLDMRMKLFDESVKKYMVKKDMKTYRALIEDVEQYYNETKRIMMYKTIN